MELCILWACIRSATSDATNNAIVPATTFQRGRARIQCLPTNLDYFPSSPPTPHAAAVADKYWLSPSSSAAHSIRLVDPASRTISTAKRTARLHR
eukprot:CCRYP_004470-RA/>CCRYP_004470-RA protein AED:0.19 eAED:0.19 QI:1369/0.66/0.5/1/0/0/4/0/94